MRLIGRRAREGGDADGSARSVRQRLNEISSVDVAVIINDSLGRPWRLGTTGTAIGVAGLPAILDLRGNPSTS